MAQAADELPAWGVNRKLRDRALREFIPVESMFGSALGIVAARNAAFSWKLTGPSRRTSKYQRILEEANFGRGWADFIARLTIDMSTQDDGAFFEVIRERDSETSEVVGIATLDAQRCWPTGIAETPVMYQDWNGKYHLLKWYQVVQVLEMPSPLERPAGLQYSALTRIMRACRIMRDQDVYISEKIGGRNARAVTLVKGVTPEQIEAAWTKAKFQNDTAGLTRFSQPVMVGSIDPKAEIGFETLELASIPDGFDLKDSTSRYINILAMGFLTDYQEFSPLPGGGLGTSQQSETLHKKSQGKGSGLFMKLIAQALNWSVLPESIEFEWDEQDADAEKLEADTDLVQAQVYQALITAGILTPQAARQIMFDAGELDQTILDMLMQQDANEEQTFTDQFPTLPNTNFVPPSGDTAIAEGAQPLAQLGGPTPPAPAAAGAGGFQPTGLVGTGTNLKSLPPAVEIARTEVEDEMTATIVSSLEKAGDELRKLVGAKEALEPLYVVKKEVERDEDGRITAVKEYRGNQLLVKRVSRDADGKILTVTEERYHGTQSEAV